jgi:ubiquinone/menaquinone biosynthesis C-methylase UbiE
MLRRGVLPAAVRPVCLDLRTASLAEVDQPHRVCASVLSLPFAARSFDTVTCLEVLEHLDDPSAAVRELARVARRAVVVSVPFEPYFLSATSCAENI